MLAFNRKTDYALISLAHMANEPSHYWSARKLANHYGMPLPLLMNVLKMLANKGLVRSERGPRGGYQLAKPPGRISLHDVIVAVDGPVALVQCLEKAVGKNGRGSRNGGCELSSRCPVQRSVHRIHHRLVGFLKTVTLADITGGTPEVAASTNSHEEHHGVPHLSG